VPRGRVFGGDVVLQRGAGGWGGGGASAGQCACGKALMCVYSRRFHCLCPRGPRGPRGARVHQPQAPPFATPARTRPHHITPSRLPSSHPQLLPHPAEVRSPSSPDAHLPQRLRVLPPHQVEQPRAQHPPHSLPSPVAAARAGQHVHIAHVVSSHPQKLLQNHSADVAGGACREADRGEGSAETGTG
jgi:hypothetical protein